MLDHATTMADGLASDTPTGAESPRAAAPAGRADDARAVAERRKREGDFRLFRKTAERFFAAPPEDDGHRRMRARCRYHLASLDAEDAPGLDRLDAEAAASPKSPRVVEIYYGKRSLEAYRALTSPSARRDWTAVVETGAALVYVQGDDGVVTATLHPAQTDRRKPEEDAIQLGRYADLELLTGAGTLESHWRAFRAYAETTSLDGEPSWAERARMGWLRLTRATLKDGRVRAPEIWGHLATAAVFVGAVAASALVLTALF